jgi:FdhD protein
MAGNRTRAQITPVEAGIAGPPRDDSLATEEPMQIRLSGDGDRRDVAVTMRTPGSDFELAAGFLFNEGIIASREQVRAIEYCVDGDVAPEERYNIVTVELGGELPDLRSLERHFYTSSACGVCGKGSLESIKMRDCAPPGPGPVVSAETLNALPAKLRPAQRLFDTTGGLHAAALFDARGELVSLREDVGRHNALDKLIGWALLSDRLPLSDHIVLVSGRSSFEILQKSVAAGVPIVCSVSAPSSLALDVAREFGVTLVGFLREGRFNIYAGAERISQVPVS